jgi:hypothetical protein
MLVAFLVHNFRTSTGPFSLCERNINETISDGKITSSEITAYPQIGNISMLKPMIDPHRLSSLQSSGHL